MCKEVFSMSKSLLEEKVDNLLNELKQYVDANPLSENEIDMLNLEIDKLLYECLYYKAKLIS